MFISRNNNCRRSNGLHETKLSKPTNSQTLGVSNHPFAVRQSSLPSHLLTWDDTVGRVNLAHENSSDEDSPEEKDSGKNEHETEGKMKEAQQTARRKSSVSARKVQTSTNSSTAQNWQQVMLFLSRVIL